MKRKKFMERCTAQTKLGKRCERAGTGLHGWCGLHGVRRLTGADSLPPLVKTTVATFREKSLEEKIEWLLEGEASGFIDASEVVIRIRDLLEPKFRVMPVGDSISIGVKK